MCQEGTWEGGSGAAAAQSLDSAGEIAQVLVMVQAVVQSVVLVLELSISKLDSGAAVCGNGS